MINVEKKLNDTAVARLRTALFPAELKIDVQNKRILLDLDVHEFSNILYNKEIV